MPSAEADIANELSLLMAFNKKVRYLSVFFKRLGLILTMVDVLEIRAKQKKPVLVEPGKYVTILKIVTELKHSTQRNQYLVSKLLKKSMPEAVGEYVDLVRIPKWFEEDVN